MAKKSVRPKSFSYFTVYIKNITQNTQGQIFALVSQENTCVSVSSRCHVVFPPLKLFRCCVLRWLDMKDTKMLNSVKYHEYRQVGGEEKTQCWKDQLNLCEATVSPLERALLYKTSFLDFAVSSLQLSQVVKTPAGWSYQCLWWRLILAASGKKQLRSTQCKSNKAEIACI